jgi:calcineurin-like phosphoesterase family protein
VTNLPLVIVPDIHGEYERLEDLLNLLGQFDYLTNHRLAFLGDFVGRGPHSRLVVDRVSELVKQGHLAVAGNWEIMLEAACWKPADADPRLLSELWLRSYERNILASYEVQAIAGSPCQTLAALRQRLEEFGHDRFLRNLPLYLEYQRFILVHAGLDPSVSWPDQRSILQNRYAAILDDAPQVSSSKLAAYDGELVPGRCVVSGHLPTATGPHIGLHRAQLDCGSGHGGPLIAWITDQRLLVLSHGEGRTEVLPVQPRPSS